MFTPDNFNTPAPALVRLPLVPSITPANSDEPPLPPAVKALLLSKTFEPATPAKEPIVVVTVNSSVALEPETFTALEVGIPPLLATTSFPFAMSVAPE